MTPTIHRARIRTAKGLRSALALVAGMVYPLAFAPYAVWPAALIAFALLYAALGGAGRGQALLRCFLFGIGKFGVGAYWIFVSLNSYADISVALAVGLFLTFLILASALSSLIAFFVVATRYPVMDALIFAVGCCIAELAVSMPVALSFPWLHLGYALIDTPLASFAPLGGVWLVGFAAALSAAAIAQAFKRVWGGVVLSSAIWCAGWLLPTASWEDGEDVSVALVQGNVPLHVKWRPGAWEEMIAHHLRLSRRAGDARLVVWAESAIPANIRDIEDRVAASLQALDGRILFGTFERAVAGLAPATYNVVAALDGGEIEVFRKAHLVPFSEYIPLREVFGDLLRPLGYPMSSLTAESAAQAPLRIGEMGIAVALCYEVAYAQIVRRRANAAELLVVLSEDSWLGDTTGPWQHMQIARMRALETGKFLVRATNDGVTAIVDPTGTVTAALDRFQAGVLRGGVAAIGGSATPFSRLGLIPIATLILLVLIAGRVFRARERVGPDGGGRMGIGE